MRSVLRQARACLVEARPSVQLIFLLRFLAGAVLAGPVAHLPLSRIAIGAVGWPCATMATYIYNGVADRREDIGNGSSRPIATGRLPVPFALGATVTLAVLACVAAACLGPASIALTIVYLAIGYAYSGPPFPLKQTFYTCTAGGMGLGFATYLAGCLAAGHGIDPTLDVFAGAMTIWMGGVGGIAKELSDVEGDRLAGRRTWPIVIGEWPARVLLAGVAIAVGVGFLFAAQRYADRLIWSAATVVLGGVSLAIVGLSALARGDRHRRRLPYRVFMWTQHVSHLALGVTVWVLSAS